MELAKLESLTLDERKALLGELVPETPWEVFGTISKDTLSVFFTEQNFDFKRRATLDYLHTNHPLQANKVTKIGQVSDLLKTPQLALFVRKPLGGSTISRNKTITNETNTNKNQYWMRCLICGTDQPTSGKVISEAHILEGVKDYSYDEFGTVSGFADELDPASARNYIPLCGTQGDVGTCHDTFDTYKIALLYNPLKSAYFLYTPQGHFHAAYHGKIIDKIPPQYLPYKRLLAARAYATGFQCLDEAMLNLPTLTMGERGSLRSSSDTSDQNRGIESSADEEAVKREKRGVKYGFPSGKKRGLESSAEEEAVKRQKRAVKYGMSSASSAAAEDVADSAGSWDKVLVLAAGNKRA